MQSGPVTGCCDPRYMQDSRAPAVAHAAIAQERQRAKPLAVPWKMTSRWSPTATTDTASISFSIVVMTSHNPSESHCDPSITVAPVAEGSRGILQGSLEGKVRHRETMMKDHMVTSPCSRGHWPWPSNTPTKIVI